MPSGLAVATIILGLGTDIFAQSIANRGYRGVEAADSEIIFKLAPESNALPALQIGLDADRVQQLGGASGIYVLHSSSKTVAELKDLLSGRDDVIYAEPNYIYHLTALPNDPFFSMQWGLNNTQYPGRDIHAVPAWDIATGSTQNVVGVLDTGVDYTHPDLAANIWSAPASFTVNLSFGSLTCPAGSHGYNALAHSCDPMDANGHGTHVSGIIGASGNNAIGVTGVNWTASIMPLKIASAPVLGTVQLSDAIDAIEFAIQVKSTFANTAAPVNVRVLSNSWGGSPFSQALLDEINKANANNMLFVAAAGNLSQNDDIYPLYPASYNAPNVISVAATTSNDTLASFSDFGPLTVHLGAPGATIYSTLPGATYGYDSGTSMATPMVAGAAALVLSACNLNTTALKSLLLNTVDPIAGLTGRTITDGRLNVNTAIRSCALPQPPGGTATFLRIDATTQGNWKGQYGKDGYSIANDSTTYPAYATVSVSPSATYTWTNSTGRCAGFAKRRIGRPDCVDVE